VQWRKDELDLARETTLARNRWILTAFLSNGIEIHGDFNPKIFHQKFVLRDYRKGAIATTALLSGSANFTDNDTHKNLNNVFVFDDAAQPGTRKKVARGGVGGRRLIWQPGWLASADDLRGGEHLGDARTRLAQSFGQLGLDEPLIHHGQDSACLGWVCGDEPTLRHQGSLDPLRDPHRDERVLA
jgi:hypothetical protein